MYYAWLALSSTGIFFQLMLLRAMAKDGYRRFPIFFAYVIVLFLSSVTAMAAFYRPNLPTGSSRYYWIVESICQFLLFGVVISLIYKVSQASASRAPVGRALAAGTIAATLLLSYVSYQDRFGRWMTELSRNLGFLAVILNLILWAVLIKSPDPNRTLLMVSGGLGIQMAGKAVGHSFRAMSRALVVPGDLVIVLSNLACLYIWWQAFRGFDRRQPGRVQ